MSDIGPLLSWLQRVVAPHKEANIARAHGAFLAADPEYVSDTFDWHDPAYKNYADVQIAAHAYRNDATPFTLTVYIECSNDPTFPAKATTSAYTWTHTETNTIRGFPIPFAGFRYARVRAPAPDVDLADFHITSHVTSNLTRNRGRQISGTYPEDTNLEFLVGAVQFGDLPQGGAASVGITRRRSSKVSIEELGLGISNNLLSADTTSAGSAFAEGRRDDIDHNWSEDDPNLVMTDSSSGGTAGLVAGEGQAFWKTGTGSGNTCVFRTRAQLFYNANHDVYGAWTTEWVTAPTHANSSAWKGLLTAQNGIATGFSGTDEAILFRRAGVDTPILRTNWNLDSLTGADDSKYTDGGVPVAADMMTPQRIRVRGALLGAETFLIEFRSPDKVWVPVHAITRINQAGVSGSLFSGFNFNISVELDNAGSTTDIELRSGSCNAHINTSEPSAFTQLLTRQLHNTDELRLDVEPTSAAFYLGKAADGTPTADAIWDVMQISLSGTRNPNRIRFRRNVAWDSRTSGW